MNATETKLSRDEELAKAKRMNQIRRECKMKCVSYR